jgi:hypothetical protein
VLYPCVAGFLPPDLRKPLEFFRMVFKEPEKSSRFRRQLDALVGAHRS